MNITTFHSLHSRNAPPKFIAEIHDTPLWKHAVYRAYHYYDMRFPVRVPGWTRFEKWLMKHDAEPLPCSEPRWRDRLVSWTVNQDFRCYKMDRWAHHGVVEIEVDEDAYKKLTRRD